MPAIFDELSVFADLSVNSRQTAELRHSAVSHAMRVVQQKGVELHRQTIHMVNIYIYS